MVTFSSPSRVNSVWKGTNYTVSMKKTVTLYTSDGRIRIAI